MVISGRRVLLIFVEKEVEMMEEKMVGVVVEWTGNGNLMIASFWFR